MGKADLKVTVGLLVLGVAIGAVVLKIASPPPKPAQEIPRGEAAPRAVGMSPAQLSRPAAQSETGSSAAQAGQAAPMAVPPSTSPALKSSQPSAATQQFFLPDVIHTWTGMIVKRDATSLTIELVIPEVADGSRYHTEERVVTWSQATAFSRAIADSAWEEAPGEAIQADEVQLGDVVTVTTNDNIRLATQLMANTITVVARPPAAPADRRSPGSEPVIGQLAAIQDNLLTVTIVDSASVFSKVDTRKVGRPVVAPGRWSVRLSGSPQINRVLVPTPKPARTASDPPPALPPLSTTPVTLQDLRVGDHLAIYFSSKDDAGKTLDAKRVDLVKTQEGKE
ncbi:MAG: hypothetical protein HYY58_00575 [Candidatus Omnitrophica bacterium]|nr:hypothetical protein [Candidatus Omnitrophota bacterium]